MPVLRIEPTKQSELETDEGLLRTVWGLVYADGDAHAVYYVRWNDTALGEALFLTSIGQWGDGSSSEERDCVAVLGRVHESRLAFQLIDAGETSFADNEFLGSMREAAEVRGTELGEQAFHILDHLLVEDARVAELRQRLEAGSA